MGERRPFVNGTFAVAAAALRAHPSTFVIAFLNAGVQVYIYFIYSLIIYA